jgi:dTMP kinase
MAGLFISFEGGEGSGKTTQINRLAQALVKEGHKVQTTREPGGTPEAEKIRSLLVQRDGGNWSPLSEVLLLFAARTLHVEKVIKPALESGKIVISDRFTDSTRAYQGYGHGLPLEKIEEIDRAVLEGFKPDLTFILDIDAAAGLARSERRLAGEHFMGARTEDRFEKLELEFHERLRAGFLSIAGSDPARCRVIDAAQNLDSIAAQIRTALEEKL